MLPERLSCLSIVQTKAGCGSYSREPGQPPVPFNTSIMKKLTAALCAFLYLAVLPLAAQDTTDTDEDSNVYKTTWADGVITAAGIGVSYWGLTILQDKEGLSEAELLNIQNNLEREKADIPGFDRWAAGNFNPSVANATDIPFYGSFALPFFFLADERTRSDFGQIGLLYVQTMSVTGSLFTHVAGRTERNRPLVYNFDADNEDRNDSNAENSFFAGHTAATATATFFAAKVFNDYFPNSRAKPYVWAGAALIPAAVAYGRLEAGKHFLSDNLLGYAVGASVGILVPHLHKISRNKNFTFIPITGPYDGLAFRYTF